MVTNFFTEFKLITSDMLVASRQARYAGAIGARATHKLRSFEIEDLKVTYDNKAYIITAIFLEGLLRLYAHRPIRPLIPGGSTQYRESLIKTFGMSGSPHSFRMGITAFRNARELAMRKRDEFIAAANARIRVRNLAATSVST